MSFYDRFVFLCEQNNVKPSRAAEDCGINRSNVSNWKSNGSTPRDDAIRRIADYFNVSTDYLIGHADQKEKPLVNGDEELTEYLEILKIRPEMRMLFQLSKDATKEDVEAAVRIIEALRNK